MHLVSRALAGVLLVTVAAGCRAERTASRSAPPATPGIAPTPLRIPPSAPAAAPAEPAQSALPVTQALGWIALTTDHPCVVTVDGVEIGRLRRDSSDLFSAAPGRHLLEAIDSDSGRSWARLIDVEARQRVDASIRFVSAMEEEAAGFKAELPAMDFVRIAAGEFTMGSDAVNWPEGPRHLVRIGRPFEMARGLITQAQWKRVIRRNPTPWELEGDERPVVNVSWEETQQFVSRINALDGRRVYRLPTEAEWEYASRAGSGREVEPPDPNVRTGLGVRGAAGAARLANAWGLFDMRGAVSEWCQDWYEQDYYKRSPSTDPQGPPNGSAKVFRGGAFAINAEGVRPAARASYPTTTRTDYIGFRIVRVSP